MTQIEPGRLSVIVPVYNVEAYLPQCADALLHQSWPDTEIILVDDGSTDSSGAICDSLHGAHPDRIRVLHRTNAGASAARNAGLDMATGEYITFADSDDAMRPTMYTDIIHAMRKQGVAVGCTDLVKWDGDLSALRQVQPVTPVSIIKGTEYLKRLFNWKANSHAGTKVYTRKALEGLRFKEGVINEDFVFVSQLMTRTDSVVVLPGQYYLYRTNPTGVSHTFNRKFFDIFPNLDEVVQMLPADNPALTESFRRYSLQMHIMSGVKIVRNHCKHQYANWLKRNRREIRRNWRQVLLPGGLSLRWRIKAAYTFL